jgi:urea carboxylase-associated protein 2
MTDKMAASSELLYEDTLAGGCHWSLRMRRGTTLRLIDVEGGANLGMLFYNPDNLLERYNAPDTLKCQHTFKLTRGHCLYSDMGRIFCSIIGDSVGWHETVNGSSTAKLVAQRWGQRDYQADRNDWHQNGYDAFLVELAKYGLGRRDMAAPLNLFTAVSVDDEGNMAYAQGNSKAGDHVDLRFEMDTLVLMHTCPHPLNTADEYLYKPVTYQIRQAAPVASDDECMNACGENQRGFQNNHIYHLGAGGAS